MTKKLVFTYEDMKNFVRQYLVNNVLREKINFFGKKAVDFISQDIIFNILWNTLFTHMGQTEQILLCLDHGRCYAVILGTTFLKFLQ